MLFVKRPVCLLTNIHSSEMIVKQQRERAGQHGQRALHKPAAIEVYNQNMGGVNQEGSIVCAGDCRADHG